MSDDPVRTFLEKAAPHFPTELSRAEVAYFINRILECYGLGLEDATDVCAAALKGIALREASDILESLTKPKN